MKVLQIYNEHRNFGGETVVVEYLREMLIRHDHSVIMEERDSKSIVDFSQKLIAFRKGIYSWQAKREMKCLLKKIMPDIVHVHNLYPLFSPSVLIACRQEGIPTVMTIHNFALTCPNWAHLYNENICEKCVGGHEYWCVLKNCRGNIFESIAYALRTAVARRFRLFYDNVTLFIAMTEFVRGRLVDSMFQKEKIVVVPNMVSIPDSAIDPSVGCYVAFAGRMTPEKGVDTLLAAAARLPEISVRIAGGGPIINELIGKAPDNAEFVGLLNAQEMVALYRRARFLVVPSICFETFGLVIVEAMSHGLPVIASRIGGIPEIVDDGVTGLLFEPGNSEDLAKKMKRVKPIFS